MTRHLIPNLAGGFRAGPAGRRSWLPCRAVGNRSREEPRVHRRRGERAVLLVNGSWTIPSSSFMSMARYCIFACKERSNTLNSPSESPQPRRSLSTTSARCTATRLRPSAMRRLNFASSR
jgi:hypothetical protein